MKTLAETTRKSIKAKQEQRELQRRKGILGMIMRQQQCSLEEACKIHVDALTVQLGAVPIHIAKQLEIIQRDTADWCEMIGNIG